jgi:hypothetical protein
VLLLVADSTTFILAAQNFTCDLVINYEYAASGDMLDEEKKQKKSKLEARRKS